MASPATMAGESPGPQTGPGDQMDETWADAATRAAYRTFQSALSATILPGSRLWHAMLNPRGEAPSAEALGILAERVEELLETDLENVRRGFYPRELLFQIPLSEYVTRVLPEAVLDELGVVGVFLADEAGLGQLALAQQVDHRARARGRGDLNGAVGAAFYLLAIDFARDAVLGQQPLDRAVTVAKTSTTSCSVMGMAASSTSLNNCRRSPRRRSRVRNRASSRWP